MGDWSVFFVPSKQDSPVTFTLDWSALLSNKLLDYNPNSQFWVRNSARVLLWRPDLNHPSTVKPSLAKKKTYPIKYLRGLSFLESRVCTSLIASFLCIDETLSRNHFLSKFLLWFQNWLAKMKQQDWEEQKNTKLGHKFQQHMYRKT